MKRLYGTYKDWRNVALTVTCPQCNAGPGRDCRGPGVDFCIHPTVHVGRLKAAVPEPRDEKFWWLTEHDALLAGVR